LSPFWKVVGSPPFRLFLLSSERSSLGWSSDPFFLLLWLFFGANCPTPSRVFANLSGNSFFFFCNFRGLVRPFARRPLVLPSSLPTSFICFLTLLPRPFRTLNSLLEDRFFPCFPTGFPCDLPPAPLPYRTPLFFSDFPLESLFPLNFCQSFADLTFRWPYWLFPVTRLFSASL